MTVAYPVRPHRLLRLLRLLRLSIWRNCVQWWTFRSFLITIVAGQTVTPLLGLLVWTAALPGNAAVSTYYLLVLAVQLMTVSFEHHTLSNGIYAGGLVADLLKPWPVVLSYFGENLALRMWHTIFGLPLFVVIGFTFEIRSSPGALLAAVPAVLLAGLLRFAFTYVLALSALWTQRAHGVVGVGETLIFVLGGTAAPIGFLPEPYGTLGHLLPFWSMLGMPAEIAAGMVSGADMWAAYGTQLAWLGIAGAVSLVVWHRGVRRFTAFGG